MNIIEERNNNISTIKVEGNLDTSTAPDLQSYLDKVFKDGADLSVFVSNLFRFVMDVMKYLIYPDLKITTLPVNYEENVKRLTNFDNAKQYYQYLVNKVLNLKNDIKNESDIRSLVEVYLIQICRCI